MRPAARLSCATCVSGPNHPHLPNDFPVERVSPHGHPQPQDIVPAAEPHITSHRRPACKASAGNASSSCPVGRGGGRGASLARCHLSPSCRASEPTNNNGQTRPSGAASPTDRPATHRYKQLRADESIPTPRRTPRAQSKAVAPGSAPPSSDGTIRSSVPGKKEL